MWVPDHLGTTLGAITVDGGEVETMEAGRYPSAGLAVDGEIWVANYGDGSVSVLAG